MERGGLFSFCRKLHAPYYKYFKSQPGFLTICLLQGESVFFVMTNLIVTPNQRQATCPEVGRTEPLDPQTPAKPGVRTDRGHFWSNKERKDERQVVFSCNVIAQLGNYSKPGRLSCLNFQRY